MSVIEEPDFAAKTRALLDRHGPALLVLAKRSIDHALDTGKSLAVDLATQPPELTAPGACFVTLKKNGQLRGCIGSPEAHRPLVADVAENAYRAAFRDPRFAPLDRAEAEALELHLSVLSPAHPMTIANEADLIAQLEPGVDGLIIGDGPRRALFLPSVWAQLPEPRQFLAHLKAKAGMPPDHWSDTFQAYRFIAAEVGAPWTDIDVNGADS